MSALVAVTLMSRATSVLEIWTRGILAMFLGRFAVGWLELESSASHGLLPKFVTSRKKTTVKQSNDDYLNAS